MYLMRVAANHTPGTPGLLSKELDFPMFFWPWLQCRVEMIIEAYIFHLSSFDVFLFSFGLIFIEHRKAIWLDGIIVRRWILLQNFHKILNWSFLVLHRHGYRLKCLMSNGSSNVVTMGWPGFRRWTALSNILKTCLLVARGLEFSRQIGSNADIFYFNLVEFFLTLRCIFV